jgi:mobilization protein NikA
MEEADQLIAADGELPVADTARRRRSRSGERPHCKRVAISVDADEYGELEAAAVKAGLTTSAYVADAALRSVRGTAVPLSLPLRDALADLIQATTQVQKVGVNLNQAVAKLNATGQRSGDLLPYASLAVKTISHLDEVADRISNRLP